MESIESVAVEMRIFAKLEMDRNDPCMRTLEEIESLLSLDQKSVSYH